MDTLGLIRLDQFADYKSQAQADHVSRATLFTGWWTKGGNIGDMRIHPDQFLGKDSVKAIETARAWYGVVLDTPRIKEQVYT